MSRMNKRRRLAFSDSLLVLLQVIVSIFQFQTHRVSSSDVPLVIGPSQTIVAFAGDNVTLPCHLKPETDASAMRLEWARPDLSPGFVHVWAKSREYVLDKQPSYRGRTFLSTSKLQLGDISLKLFNVMLSDEGTYRCLVPQLGRKAFVKLVVCAVSTPVILVMSERGSAVVLECKSTGWYPEPELLWLDGEGNLLSAGATETFRGPDDLYTVSSRVTVEKRHGNKLTCRVQQKNINQSKETLIHVADDFVTDPPPPSPSSSPVLAIIGLIVGIMFTLAVVFFVWKWRQIKLKKKKKDHSDEETVKIREKTNSSGGNDDLTESLIGREAAENVNMEKNPLSDRTGSDIQTKDETQQSQTNNHLTQTQEETEKQPDHERAELQPLVNEGRQSGQPLEIMSDPDKDQEDTTNNENSPAEIEVNNEGNETESVRENADTVMDEKRQEQPKGERNVDMEGKPLSERTGSDILSEDETQQSHTNNHLTQTQEETENQPGHERAELQPLVDEGRPADQPLDTMSGSDKYHKGTTNRENETKAVRKTERETAENLVMERNPSSERTGTHNQTEDETHGSETNNLLTQTQEETEKQSGAVIGNTNTVMDEETQQEQLIGERNTENNLQAEGENNLQEVQSDLNKEMENLKSKLQAKEKDERGYEKRVTRMMGQKMEQEKEIKDLKEQLEEMERKLHLKKEETQTEEDEKDLQKKKEELQKQLKRFETAVEKSNKELDILTQKKMKATQEKEEIIRKLEMKNMNENQNESDDDL